MDSNGIELTIRIPQDEEVEVEAHNRYTNVEDTRRLVKDTTKYPHNAVAFVESQYYSSADEFAATGFLCDDFIFMTAAHNVRNGDGEAAKAVKITFGLNGEKDYPSKKQIILDGSEFTVPKNYKKKTDHCDIAWINLQNYYDKKVGKGDFPSWNLSDLPESHFYTCSIPEEDGKLKKNFRLSGKFSANQY